MAAIPNRPEGNRTALGRLTHEIAIQAELLALNSALDGAGAEEASEALRALSRELRLVSRARFGPRGTPGAGEQPLD
jgi:hypothetical protein